MNTGKLIDSHLFAFVTIAFLHNTLCNTTVHKDITHESTPHMIHPQLFTTSAGILNPQATNVIYIHEAPILDVSRSHTTTQHSR